MKVKEDRPVVGLILNFRDSARTAACVTNLLEHGATHVLVWDNSDDLEHSAKALHQNFGQDSRVSIHVSPANLGFAIGVNQGLRWAAAVQPDAWVLLINNDACLLAGALPRLSAALRTNASARVAYPRIDHAGKVLGTVYYQPWLGFLTTHPLPGSVPYPSGCCLLIAPERNDSLLFDEDFFMYGEDIEFGLRMRGRSTSMAYVSEKLVKHEGSASSGMSTRFYEERMVAAHFILARKVTVQWWTYWVLLISRAAIMTARAVLRTWRYRSTAPLFALHRGWRLAQGHDPMLERARSAARSTP